MSPEIPHFKSPHDIVRVATDELLWESQVTGTTPSPAVEAVNDTLWFMKTPEQFRQIQENLASRGPRAQVPDFTPQEEINLLDELVRGGDMTTEQAAAAWLCGHFLS